MHEVATSASHDFDILMDELEARANKYIQEENKRLKERIKEEIKKVDGLLLKKLNDLQALENSEKQTDDEKKRKEENLKWLISVKQRVNNLIEF